jgi:hypothetical protein
MRGVKGRRKESLLRRTMTDVPEGALRSPDGNYWWDESAQQWWPVAGQQATEQLVAEQHHTGPTVYGEFVPGTIVDVPEIGSGDGEEAPA